MVRLTVVPRECPFCATVVLLAQHYPHTHLTKYVLAHHYFTVPLHTPDADADPNDETMRMLYVSVPFEVVSVSGQADGEAPPQQQPRLAVDFGHAVWLEHVRAADDEEDAEPHERGQKRLRFVSYPGVKLEGEGHAVRSGIGEGGGGPDGSFEMEGAVRTLAIPEELGLHEVETINIDQSQGAVILSVLQGKIFIIRSPLLYILHGLPQTLRAYGTTSTASSGSRGGLLRDLYSTTCTYCDKPSIAPTCTDNETPCTVINRRQWRDNPFMAMTIKP